MGYAHSHVGTAARWKLLNTGHGYNVIPSFTYNGMGAYTKTMPNDGGAESDIQGAGISQGMANNLNMHSLGYMTASRELAAGGSKPLPAGYYVKKLNAKGDKIMWYSLLQFHFHFPSEHTVDGYQYAGEMHLVHGPDATGFVPTLMTNVTRGSGRMLNAEKGPDGKEGMVLDLTNVKTRELAGAGAYGGSSSGASSSSSPYQHVSLGRDTKSKNSHGQDWVFNGDGAVVLGFFLEEDASMNGGTPDTTSILRTFGFNSATGLPYTRGNYWSVDVDSKMFSEKLFGKQINKKSASLDQNGNEVLHSNHLGEHIDKTMELGYFNYMGGLTTPPCAEGVQFVIFSKPLKVRSSEANLFRQNYFMNNRPTQPRGKRVVLYNDMANAAQPLTGVNRMKAVNPFAPPAEETQTQTFLVAGPASGAVSSALNMLVAGIASAFAFVFLM